MPLRVELDPVQSRALALIRPGTTAVFPWGRGSGKTYFDRTLLYKFCFEEPGDVGLLMPTLKRARQVFWPSLMHDLAGPLRPFVRRLDATLLECQFKNGSRLTTWGAENADAIRGQRFRRLVQDECDEIDAAVEHAVVEPTFSKSGTNAIWVKTGTPKKGRLGILYRDYKRALEGYSDGARRYVGFSVPSWLSPQVDQAWLKSIKLTTPKKIFDREYGCNFDSAEGLVYGDVFESSFHVREPPAGIVWTEILIGCDHGFEDAGVFLLIGVQGSGRDAVCWVLDEVYAQHRVPRWWKEQLRIWTGWYPHHKFYADPSRPETVEEYRIECGARVQEFLPNRLIEDGVQAVADRFFIVEADEEEKTPRRARLFVSPKCVNLIRELGLYKRKKDPRSSGEDPVFLDEFAPGNDHAPDALRYPIYNRFGGPDRGRDYGSHEERQ